MFMIMMTTTMMTMMIVMMQTKNLWLNGYAMPQSYALLSKMPSPFIETWGNNPFIGTRLHFTRVFQILRKIENSFYHIFLIILLKQNLLRLIHEFFFSSIVKTKQ